MIGAPLRRVAINWVGRGLRTVTRVVVGVPTSFPNTGYAQPLGVAVAAFVLTMFLAQIKWGCGSVANAAVLLCIATGLVLAASLGSMAFDKVAAAPSFNVVLPFRFGVPEFLPVPIATMCVVMVVMVESLGMFLSLGKINGRRIGQDELTRGVRADGIGTAIGSVFNTFPCTSF